MTTNYLHVTEGFQILTEVLPQFVARELRARFSGEWWNRGVLDVLHEHQRRDFPASGEDTELIGSLDAARCLLLMDLQWNEVFRSRLSRDHRTWIKELMSTRNRWAWAHGGPMVVTDDDAWRALDTMVRLVQQMDARAAERLRALAHTVRSRDAGSSTPVNPGDSRRSPDERRHTHGDVPASAGSGVEGFTTRFGVDESPGPDEAGRRAVGEVARGLSSERQTAATIRSGVATAAATQRSRTVSPAPTVRSGEGAAPSTVISGTRPETPPDEGRPQSGPHGRLPAAIGDTMQIIEELPARGAEADLYIAEDAAGTRHVAKVYRRGHAPKEEVLARIRKASATHIVKLENYVVGGDDGRSWELLEYIEHGNLRERLAEAGGALPEADARRVLTQLADGLDSLHEIGLEHRDLKPENVLVRQREPLDVVIADWGIASVLEATVRFTTAARTIRYAPPEATGTIVTSNRGANRTESVIERTRWDAWSLGMMAVEMRTGKHPFEQVSEQVIGHRLATQSVETLCEHVADPAWRLLCRGLLRRRPADRWGTGEIRRWLDDPHDPELAVADEQPVLAHAGIYFDGQCFTDPRALGRALQQADQAKAESYLERKFPDLHTWITDTLGKGELGEALAEVDRDRALSLGERVFHWIHLLWPEDPIIPDGLPLREDALHEAARRAWQGDEEAAARLLRTASDSRVRIAVGLDASGEIQRMQVAWERAAEGYTNWRKRLADQGVSIPEWRNSESGIAKAGRRRKRKRKRKHVSIPDWRDSESGTPDEKIEVQTVAGVEIRVDTSTGAPRLPVQIQAAVLGAAIGETTCAGGLRSMAERATLQWRETEAWLAEAHSADVEHAPAALAGALYGAPDLQKRDDEETKRREARRRHRARETVWKWYGAVGGLCLGTAFAIGSELLTDWVYWISAIGLSGVVGFFIVEDNRAVAFVVGSFLGAVPTFCFEQQIVLLYWASAALLVGIGYCVGAYLEGDSHWCGGLSPPANDPGTSQDWRRRHVLTARIVAAFAVAWLWVLSPDGPHWLIVVPVAVIGLWLLRAELQSDVDARA